MVVKGAATANFWICVSAFLVFAYSEALDCHGCEGGSYRQFLDLRFGLGSVVI